MKLVLVKDTVSAVCGSERELTGLEANLNHNLFILERLHRGSWLSFLSLCNHFETQCTLQYTCLLCSLQLCYEYHCLRICSNEQFGDGGEGGENWFLYLPFCYFSSYSPYARKNLVVAELRQILVRGEETLLPAFSVVVVTKSICSSAVVVI